MPVKGVRAVIEVMFKTICPPIHEAIPTARILENLSGALAAILKALKIKYMKTKIKMSEPIKPISSDIAANIESVEASGRKRYFCLD